MQSITACQRMVSERFPIASFVVQMPPERLFEIACATDASLFNANARQRRTPHNFFTTRGGGLLRAPGGQATYLLPPEQLQRFAGSRRLYYAVGSYTGPRGENPCFTAALEAPEAAPSIQISSDFTGRSLDRKRFGKALASARYGGTPTVLSWGGDLLVRAEGQAPLRTAPPVYDDGHSPALWASRAEPGVQSDMYGGAGSGAHGQRALVSLETEPAGFEDAPALARFAAGTSAQAASRLSPPRGGIPNGARRAPSGRAVAIGSARPQSSSLHHETYGSVGAAAPSAHRFGGLSALAGAEPPGFEDAPALRSAGRGSTARYAGAAARVIATRPALERSLESVTASSPMSPGVSPGVSPAMSPAASYPASPPGRDDGYDEEHYAEGDLPVDLPDAPVRAVTPLAELSIPEKFKIVLAVAPAESGGDKYSAVNADTEYADPHHPAYQRYHIGLSWGIVQFTQRGGALGRVLEACARRDPDRFRSVFGDSAEELLAVTNAPGSDERVAPVAGSNLWQEPWLQRFRDAGQVAAFQAAQNEIAIEGYLDPNLQFAAWFGLDTDRALAMLYDRCVNMGNAGGRSFVALALGPIRTQAQRNAALAALGKPDLRAFQRDTEGLEEDGQWGPLTHAALTGALRSLGPDSPVGIPALAELLDRLVSAAKGRRFEARLRALRSATELRDTAYRIG